MLWACQSVAFWISARVAPLGRPISSRIWWLLLSARGAPVLVWAGFFPALAAGLRAALVWPPLAAFWPLGAPFFGLAPFFEEAFSSATWAPGSATVTAV